MTLNVKGNKRMEAVVRSNVSEGDVVVRLNLKLSKEDKMVTISAEDSDIKAAAGEYMTENGLRTEIGPIIGTFKYTVKKDKLILKDVESKYKLVFVKD